MTQAPPPLTTKERASLCRRFDATFPNHPPLLALDAQGEILKDCLLMSDPFDSLGAEIKDPISAYFMVYALNAAGAEYATYTELSQARGRVQHIVETILRARLEAVAQLIYSDVCEAVNEEEPEERAKELSAELERDVLHIHSIDRLLAPDGKPDVFNLTVKFNRFLRDLGPYNEAGIAQRQIEEARLAQNVVRFTGDNGPGLKMTG